MTEAFTQKPSVHRPPRAPATVADVMRPAPATGEPRDHVAAAAYLMKHAGVTALVVVDDDQARQPAGVITDPGLCELFRAGLAQRQARSARAQILIRDGRPADDSLGPIWAKPNDEGLAGLAMPGRHLLESGQLRDGSTLTRYATCCGATSRSTPANGWSSPRAGRSSDIRAGLLAP